MKKKLVFCTYPSFYSSIVLNSLLKSPDIEIVAVISSTRNLKAKESTIVSTLKRITTSGFHYTGYLWLISEGYSLVSKFKGTDNIQTLSRKNNIPVYKTNDINSDTIKNILLTLDLDILLCAHFNQRIAPEIYSLAKESALNIHPSLLPDLKGVDPSFYALLEGYNSTGVSLHLLDSAFDTGTLVTNQKHKIHNNDSLFSLNCQLFQIGGELCVSYFKSNNKNQIVNSSTKSRYDSWPRRINVNQFRKKRALISCQDIRLFWGS